ncbi:hypothetical protein FOL47_007313 [Perkinsus chesapeaki]|uniref:Uncharacterized protein n=1 Tax=Perkinsus chesapeaki TaxID=330153 RepID=A0A7J6LL87_PERCH|nr:hypothetical protein FOL47_007313 [Perkinsus chesapeaki]
MSAKQILSSLCGDEELVGAVSKSLSDHGVTHLRLLESLSSDSDLFKAVLAPIKEDESLRAKAPLAAVLLSSATHEAAAQLNYAVSTAIASNPKPSTLKERVSFANAIRKVQSQLGSLVFVPSQRMLDLLYRGGVHTFVNFNSQMAKSSQKEVEVAVTTDGAPILIRGGSQFPFDVNGASDDGESWFNSAQFLKVFFTWSAAVLIVQAASQPLDDDMRPPQADGEQTAPNDEISPSTNVAPHHLMAYLSRLLEVASGHGWKAAIMADGRIRQKADDLVRAENMTFAQALTNEMVASSIIVDVVASVQLENIRRGHGTNPTSKQTSSRKKAKLDPTNSRFQGTSSPNAGKESVSGKGKGRSFKPPTSSNTPETTPSSSKSND